MYRLIACLLACLLITTPAFAANIYTVTSQQAERTITYEVTFGGTRLQERYTAFDPVSKKFAYLTWKRDAKSPQPAAEIWDHSTGRTVPLYQFPGVEQPLPVIPSIKAMKVCPLTCDPDYKANLLLIAD